MTLQNYLEEVEKEYTERFIESKYFITGLKFLKSKIQEAYQLGKEERPAERVTLKNIKQGTEVKVYEVNSYNRGWNDGRKSLIQELIKELPEEKSNSIEEDYAECRYANGWDECRKEVLNILNSKL